MWRAGYKQGQMDALTQAADALAADPLWGEQWPTQWLRARAKQVGE